LASGEQLSAFGLTEAMAVSDASGTRTIAVREGNDYILNGTKIFITIAYYSDVYIVTARWIRAKGIKELQFLSLNKECLDSPSVKKRKNGDPFFGHV